MLWIWRTILQTLQIDSCCYCVEKIGVWHVVTIDLNWRLLEHALPNELKPDLFAGECWTFEEMHTTCQWLTIIIDVSRVLPGCKMMSWKEKQSIEIHWEGRQVESAEASLEFSDSKLFAKTSPTAEDATRAWKKLRVGALCLLEVYRKILRFHVQQSSCMRTTAPAISAFPKPPTYKGKTSTTWCTIVFVAATVPTAQDMARRSRSVSCVALMDLLETTIDQLETTVWDSGPMGAQSMLLDILDSIQIGNHGLLVPTNLWLALDWLDSDLFQGSNWPLFLQISILQGAIAVNGLELHDSFCCCSWGLTGRRGYLWVFCRVRLHHQTHFASGMEFDCFENQYLDALHFMYFQNSSTLISAD